MYLHLMMLTPVLPSWLGRQPHFARAPLIHVYHRRHDGTQDVCHALWDDHQPRTSGTTAVLKSVQRYAPRPVCCCRETWTAVAIGGEKIQRLSRSPLCDGSAYRGRLLGRHRRRSVRLPPLPSSRTPDRLVMSSQQMALLYYEFFAANGVVVHTHNPAFEFGPTTGVFMVFFRGTNGTHHRLRLSLLV
jgi:hypothetical protein